MRLITEKRTSLHIQQNRIFRRKDTKLLVEEPKCLTVRSSALVVFLLVLESLPRRLLQLLRQISLAPQNRYEEETNDKKQKKIAVLTGNGFLYCG